MSCLKIAVAVTLHMIKYGDEYNPIHPMVECDKKQYITRVFLNSYTKPSFQVAKDFEYDSGMLEIGVATGYNNSVIPTIRYKFKNGWFIAPTVKKQNYHNAKTLKHNHHKWYYGVLVGYRF